MQSHNLLFWNHPRILILGSTYCKDFGKTLFLSFESLIDEGFETNFLELFTSGPLLFWILVGGVFTYWDPASQKSIDQHYPCFLTIQCFLKNASSAPPPTPLKTLNNPNFGITTKTRFILKFLYKLKLPTKLD